ncbi:hypothetical protein Bca101_018012 [Brassica carinata]
MPHHKIWGIKCRRVSQKDHVYSALSSHPGGHKTLPLSKLKEEGFLENSKLIIKVDVVVVDIVHEAEITGKETLAVKGFEVLYSQYDSVHKIFKEHPNIAIDFKPKDKGVKEAYMNLLLSLIETLRKPPQSFSDTELSNAESQEKVQLNP